MNTGVYDVRLEVLVDCAGDFVEVFFGADFGEGMRVEGGFFRFGFGDVLLLLLLLLLLFSLFWLLNR